MGAHVSPEAYSQIKERNAMVAKQLKEKEGEQTGAPAQPKAKAKGQAKEKA